ncbi:phage protein NinX family protein, partial [Escherichia coli]
RDLFDDAGPNVGVAYDNPLRAAMIVFLMIQDANNA